MAETITWVIMAVLALVCALKMLVTPNPVHKALWLVGNFIALGVIYLILTAPMLFAIQLVVYAGAIMVLFLFVVMFFMNPEARRWLRPQLRSQLFFGGLAVLAFLSLLYVGMMKGGANVLLNAEAIGDEAGVALGSPVMLGSWMFNNHLFAFELMGVLLLIALIGATMVARDAKSEGRKETPHTAEVVGDADNIPIPAQGEEVQ